MFFFSPWHPKVPVTHNFVNFVTGTFDFSRADFRKFSRARLKFHGHFFRNFHGQVGNFTGISKNSCHGHFYVCHGHFCALISFFLIYSSHNKVDIWSLTCRELTIFIKKSTYRAYQVKLPPPLIKSGFGDFQKWSVKLPPLPWIGAAGGFFLTFFLIGFWKDFLTTMLNYPLIKRLRNLQGVSLNW